MSIGGRTITDRRIVEFKSTPENYKKEYLGTKNNTVRFIEPEDPRAIVLDNAHTHPFLNYLYVRIRNTKTNNYFERPIQDITYYKDITIITWEHMTENEVKVT